MSSFSSRSIQSSHKLPCLASSMASQETDELASRACCCSALMHRPSPTLPRPAAGVNAPVARAPLHALGKKVRTLLLPYRLLQLTTMAIPEWLHLGERRRKAVRCRHPPRRSRFSPPPAPTRTQKGRRRERAGVACVAVSGWLPRTPTGPSYRGSK